MRLASAFGLRWRVILGMLLASLPAVLTLFHLGESDRREANDRAYRETWRAAAAVAQEHEGLLDATREMLAALAQVPEIRNGRGAACAALLADIKRQSAPRYANFAVVQADGEVSCSAVPVPNGINLATAKFVRDALATGDFAVDQYGIGPIVGFPVLAVGYPVRTAQGTTAVIHAALDLGWLERHPVWRSLPEGASLLVLSNEGRVVLRAPYGGWSGASIADTELGRLATRGGGTWAFVTTGLDGKRRVFGHALLGSLAQPQGHILVSVPEETITAEASERRLKGLAGLAVTIALIVAVAWGATQFLVLGPLSPILATVRALAAGKLSARTGVAPGSDEIRKLAGAVDAMADTLERQRDERGVAERALRESEAHLQAIFDGLADAAVFTDADRRVRLVNPAFTSMFGYTADEAIGRSTEFLYADPADHRRLGVQHYSPSAVPDKPTFQVRFRRKDGSEFWSESTGLRVEGAGGDVIGYFGLHRDISARRWAEQALRESEERLRQAARVAGFGIFEHDHLGTVLHLSPEMRDILGVDADEPAQDVIISMIPPAERERVLAAIAKSHDPDGDGRYAAEHRIVRADGEVRWLSVHSQTFFCGEDAARRPLRTIGAAVDITERKRAEERFRGVVERAPSAIVLVNAEGRIALVNAQVEQLFGYRRRELLGQPVEMLLPPRLQADHSALRRGFLAMPESRQMAAGRELFGVRKDGHEIPLEIGLSPINTEEGVLVMAFIADITRRKEAEDAVLRLNAELERRVEERTAELLAANRELDSFAYAVSHDLRAPLRAMSGFSQALLEDYGARLGGDARLYVDQIGLASRRMGDLIDGLLALSRSTRGELRRDRVDISAMCERLLGEMARLDPARRVRWTVEPGLLARGDAAMVEAVVSNLLSNAWKYTAEREEAEIRVYRDTDGEQPTFCVADNGAGFDMAYAGKLFQPFQRLHRQDEFPGLGIGLATAQRIVHRHGGEIHARSAPGAGATFCFSLGPDEGAEGPQTTEA